MSGNSVQMTKEWLQAQLEAFYAQQYNNVVDLSGMYADIIMRKFAEATERHEADRVGLLEEYHDRVVNAETVIELQRIAEMAKGGE